MSFENNKLPGNGRPTKEFTVPFGMALKTHL